MCDVCKYQERSNILDEHARTEGVAVFDDTSPNIYILPPTACPAGRKAWVMNPSHVRVCLCVSMATAVRDREDHSIDHGRVQDKEDADPSSPDGKIFLGEPTKVQQ